jgi:hypothetical protein
MALYKAEEVSPGPSAKQNPSLFKLNRISFISKQHMILSPVSKPIKLAGINGIQFVGIHMVHDMWASLINESAGPCTYLLK